METKENKGQTSRLKSQDHSHQGKKVSKQPATAGNYCASDPEQQASSNKGKGPAGENL